MKNKIKESFADKIRELKTEAKTATDKRRKEIEKAIADLKKISGMAENEIPKYYEKA